MYPLFLNAYYKFLDCKTTTTSNNQISTNLNTTAIMPPLTLALVNEAVSTENCIDARC